MTTARLNVSPARRTRASLAAAASSMSHSASEEQLETIAAKTSPTKRKSGPHQHHHQEQQQDSWGRAVGITWLNALTVTALLLVCPVMVVYFWMACDAFQCSLSEPVRQLLATGWKDAPTWQTVIVEHLPQPTELGGKLFFGWLLFQAGLYALLPGKIGFGQQTPAGYTLPYKVNGLLAWFVTHALFLAGSSLYLGLFPASIVHDHWGSLLIWANVYGYALAAFSYVKAYWFPSHPEDCKFSGSRVYDFFMGIEFNPRFGSMWDFKLFHNGRPGIVAWTLINFSFAAAQYARIGYVTNSMVLVNWLHFCYVIDFFINEDWYLRTIDIAHDHFGFYLAWGDSVWLPFMYTLQSHYLVRNPVDLPLWFAALVFCTGMFGYYIFRAVNHQKDLVRRTDGNCLIWGKPAKFIRAKYTTSDGKQHSSILLASGWWGMARHFNYTGDLILSFSMCAACGFQHLLPWFYAIYMTILLVQRIHRDDGRCAGKYGKYWTEYKKLVRYNLIPYVY